MITETKKLLLNRIKELVQEEFGDEAMLFALRAFQFNNKSG